jgi:hypothetical protein
MSFPRFGCRGLLAVALLLAVPPLHAATVMQLNLREMVQRADRIYRGTVLSVNSETVAIGGGQLPVVTYRLRIDEVFRGEFPTVKGIRIAELRMIGKLGTAHSGSLRSVNVLPRMPALGVGQTYLLFTTRASAIGLSTTVGLGQGAFRIAGVGKAETAANEVDNNGLFRDMPGFAPTPSPPSVTGTRARQGGPLRYADLASRIHALLGR